MSYSRVVGLSITDLGENPFGFESVHVGRNREPSSKVNKSAALNASDSAINFRFVSCDVAEIWLALTTSNVF